MSYINSEYYRNIWGIAIQSTLNRDPGLANALNRCGTQLRDAFLEARRLMPPSRAPRKAVLGAARLLLSVLRLARAGHYGPPARNRDLILLLVREELSVLDAPRDIPIPGNVNRQQIAQGMQQVLARLHEADVRDDITMLHTHPVTEVFDFIESLLKQEFPVIFQDRNVIPPNYNDWAVQGGRGQVVPPPFPFVQQQQGGPFAQMFAMPPQHHQQPPASPDMAAAFFHPAFPPPPAPLPAPPLALPAPPVAVPPPVVQREFPPPPPPPAALPVSNSPPPPVPAPGATPAISIKREPSDAVETTPAVAVVPNAPSQPPSQASPVVPAPQTDTVAVNVNRVKREVPDASEATAIEDTPPEATVEATLRPETLEPVTPAETPEQAAEKVRPGHVEGHNGAGDVNRVKGEAPDPSEAAPAVPVNLPTTFNANRVKTEILENANQQNGGVLAEDDRSCQIEGRNEAPGDASVPVPAIHPIPPPPLAVFGSPPPIALEVTLPHENSGQPQVFSSPQDIHEPIAEGVTAFPPSQDASRPQGSILKRRTTSFEENFPDDDAANNGERRTTITFAEPPYATLHYVPEEVQREPEPNPVRFRDGTLLGWLETNRSGKEEADDSEALPVQDTTGVQDFPVEPPPAGEDQPQLPAIDSTEGTSGQRDAEISARRVTVKEEVVTATPPRGRARKRKRNDGERDDSIEELHRFSFRSPAAGSAKSAKGTPQLPSSDISMRDVLMSPGGLDLTPRRPTNTCSFSQVRVALYISSPLVLPEDPPIPTPYVFKRTSTIYPNFHAPVVLIVTQDPEEAKKKDLLVQTPHLIMLLSHRAKPRLIQGKGKGCRPNRLFVDAMSIVVQTYKPVIPSFNVN